MYRVGTRYSILEKIARPKHPDYSYEFHALNKRYTIRCLKYLVRIQRAQDAKLFDHQADIYIFSKQTTPFLYFEAYLKRSVMHEYQIKSFGGEPGYIVDINIRWKPGIESSCNRKA